MRFYYRRRVEVFLEHAQKRLGQPLTRTDDELLDARYHEIEQAWVKQPFRVVESKRYDGGPVNAAAEVLQKHRRVEAVLNRSEKKVQGRASPFPLIRAIQRTRLPGDRP